LQSRIFSDQKIVEAVPSAHSQTEAAPSVSSQTETEFVRFLEFPTEIRTVVWEYAVEATEPRTVNQLRAKYSIITKHPDDDELITTLSPPKPPVEGNEVPNALHASHKSRKIAQKSKGPYTRVVVSGSSTSEPGFAFHITFEVDTLYINRNYSFGPPLCGLVNPEHSVIRGEQNLPHPKLGKQARRIMVGVKQGQEVDTAWNGHDNY
jgi:hypothetical protein